MSYQFNLNDRNKLVYDGDYVHYSIPVPAIPRVCTTGALIRHFWKIIEFVNFVKRVLPDHVHRPLETRVIPDKFDTNEILESKFLGIISKYRPKNFLTDLEVQYIKNDLPNTADIPVDRLVEAYQNTVAGWCAEQMKYVTRKGD